MQIIIFIFLERWIFHENTFLIVWKLYQQILIKILNNLIFMSRNIRHSFEGKQKQYDVFFDLISTPCSVDDSLKIRVINTQTFEIFSESIDQKYIKQNQEVDCFLGPSDIYDFLIQNFPKVDGCRCCPERKNECEKCDCREGLGLNDVVVGNGSLTFPYRWGTTINRKRQVTIILPKLKLNECQTSQLRIDQLHAEVHCTQKELSENTSEMKAAIQKNTALIEKISEDLKETKDSLSTMVKKSNKNLQQSNELLAKTKESLKQVNQNLIGNNFQIGSMRQDMKYLLKRVERLENKQDNPNIICHHPENHDKLCFDLVNLKPNEAKLILKQRAPKYQIYQTFVNGFEIFTGQQARYRIKIIRLLNNCQMFGFTANSTIGTSAISYVNKESVFYCCHGHFFQTGVGMELDACGDNDEIDLEADLSQKKLRWRKNGTLLREIDVPKTMKDRTLYMAMLMNYEGEESLLMAL